MDEKKPKKILLVEDDPLIVDIYTTRLEKEGYEIENVVDGEQAIRRLMDRSYDLVILDIVLPKLTGFEFLERIEKNKTISKPKVLILSNLNQKTDVERADSLGAVKYLIKANYTPSEVAQEVKKLMN